MTNFRDVLLSMYKSLLWSILFFWIGLHASTTTHKAEIRTNAIQSTKDHFFSKGEVLVYYLGRVARADSVTYNKNTKKLLLEGSVEMIDAQGIKSHSEAIEIDTNSKEVEFQGVLLFSQNDIWVLSDKASQKEKQFYLGNSFVSSCNVANPLWQIDFSRSHYDSEEKYIRLHHAWIYIAKVPLFYTPYLAFSTDNTRRSGLLFPMFGYTKKEGFLFEQPIYWAISQDRDLEFNPQIRTKRGEGLYSTFRFVDSKESNGWIMGGYFIDHKSFQKQENNKEREFYGVQAEYRNASLWFDSSDAYTDGLYLYLNYFNTIEFQNLQRTNLSFYILEPLQESKLNYFLQNETFYAGLNTKYFIDTREEKNSKTLQQLPSLQWHQFLDRFLSDHFLYSIDVRSDRFDRHIGERYRHYGVSLPMILQDQWFYHYLNVSFEQNLRQKKYVFSNGEFVYDTYDYTQYSHILKLSSDLSKAYESFVHIMQPSFVYGMPSKLYDKGVSYEEDLTSIQKELFSVDLPLRYYEFSLGNYFYTTQAKFLFSSRLGEVDYPDNHKEYEKLHHELKIKYGMFQLYNDIYYTYRFEKISQSSTFISFNKSNITSGIGHTYQKNFYIDKPTQSVFNDLSVMLKYQLNNRYDIGGLMLYSFQEKTSKLWSIEMGYARDCWSLRFDLRSDFLPSVNGNTLINEKRASIEFTFRPLGGVRTRVKL